jgi:site-specific recombinase XerD
VQGFLGRLGISPQAFHEITLSQVDAILAEKVRHSRYARISVADLASTLRAFFRYAEQQGWCRAGLAAGIQGPRIFPHLARNTQRSYRDTLRLLLPFVARLARKAIDQLHVEDLSAERVRAFLRDLREQRGCGAATHNQRLAAIHSLAHFVSLHSPEHLPWCRDVRAIAFPKAPRPLVSYLEKAEMDALLAAPATTTAQGRRDRALLLFLYNTGARADEAAHVRVADLELNTPPYRSSSSVLLHGKGNKQRRCPL